MNKLENYLSNIDLDNSYTVISVLKQSNHCQTEKVSDENGNIFIRKYFSESMEGFDGEYRLLSQIDHPAVPKIIKMYELVDKKVVIEEFADGQRLTDYVNTYGALCEVTAVEIAKKLCEICVYLHSLPQPIIHRDIKPDNIIYLQNGEIKLIDFGAAREFKQDSVRDTVYLGTIGYAPPEQFGFGQTDARADIYGIGMTLLFMLTASTPERGQKQNPVQAGISADVSGIIKGATQFDPDKRYQSVRALLSALNSLVPVRGGSGGSDIIPGTSSVFSLICNISRYALLILYGLISLSFVVAVISSFLDKGAASYYDVFINVLKDIIMFVFAVSPIFVLGLNIFDINNKIRFFAKRRILKQIIIIFVLFFAAGFFMLWLDSLHTAGYILLQNSAAS